MPFFLWRTFRHSTDGAKQCVFEVAGVPEQVTVPLIDQAFNHGALDKVGLLYQPAQGGAGLGG